MEIGQAVTPGQVAEARALFREYERSLGIDLCFQGFEQELASLPGAYAPPSGRLLLATDGGALACCGALPRAGARSMPDPPPFERRLCRRNRFFREVAAGNRWGASGGAALAPPDLDQARAGSATEARSARQSGIVTSTTSATTRRVGPTPTASPRSPYTVGADDEAPTESV